VKCHVSKAEVTCISTLSILHISGIRSDQIRFVRKGARFLPTMSAATHTSRVRVRVRVGVVEG
jgi:hypothetical protein